MNKQNLNSNCFRTWVLIPESDIQETFLLFPAMIKPF